jgi:hypothetical protein
VRLLLRVFGIFVLIVCIDKLTATVMPTAGTRRCNNAWRTGSGRAAPVVPVRTRPRQNHAPGRRAVPEPSGQYVGRISEA